MAMTKAELAAMEALKVRLALAWPPEPPKPVDITITLEASDKPWVRAWWFNRHSMAVGLGVISGGLHSVSNYTDNQMENRWSRGSRVSMSQTSGGPWFATEADATAALHYAVAEECAKRLYGVSMRVADAMMKAREVKS